MKLTTHLFFFDFLLCLGGGLWLTVRDLLRLRCLSEAWLFRLEQRTEHITVLPNSLQTDTHCQSKQDWVHSYPNEGKSLPDKASSPTRRPTIMMFVLATAGWWAVARSRMWRGGAIAASTRCVIARLGPSASCSTARAPSGLHTGLLVVTPQILYPPIQFICIWLENQLLVITTVYTSISKMIRKWHLNASNDSILQWMQCL